MIRSIATGRIVTVDSVGGGCPYLMRDDIFFSWFATLASSGSSTWRLQNLCT